MRAQVIVRLKHGVLDPQGEAVHRALTGLGFDGVQSVRVAKLVELELADGSEAETRAQLERMADQLLANPVIESFKVHLGDEDAFHEPTDPYALAHTKDGSGA